MKEGLLFAFKIWKSIRVVLSPHEGYIPIKREGIALKNCLD
jgi:hypothetical protein